MHLVGCFVSFSFSLHAGAVLVVSLLFRCKKRRLRKATYVRTTYVRTYYHVRTYASSTVSRHFGAETKKSQISGGHLSGFL